MPHVTFRAFPVPAFSGLAFSVPPFASLARFILAVPATSAPSERIFSLAGAVVNARRSSLSPRVVDKNTIFVYENVSVNVQTSLLTSRVVDLLMDMTTWHVVLKTYLVMFLLSYAPPVIYR